jgi:long-subunit fatty acid transport protein
MLINIIKNARKVVGKKRYFILACVLWVTSFMVNSAEYSIDSKIGASATYNNNATLTAIEEREVRLNGSRVTPQATFGINTETVSSELDVRLELRRYDLDEWNTNDQYINYVLSKKLQKQTISFTAGFIRDTTRTSEFESSGIATADRHERHTAGFVWDYSPTRRIFTRVNLNWSEDEYEDPFDRFSDYENYSISLLGGYQINEKLSVNLLGSYTETEFNTVEQRVFYTDGNPFNVLTPLQTAIPETKQNTFRLGVQYAFTETLSLDASLGKTDNTRSWEVLQTDFTNAGLGTSGIVDGDAVCEPGFLGEDPALTDDLCSESSSKTDSADISLTKEWEKSNGALAYNESTQPSSDGTLFSSKTLSLNWDSKITEKQSLSARLQYGENETVYRVASIQQRNDRRYSNVTLTHFYKFLEQWQIRSSYTFRAQKYDRILDTDKADSNYFSLGIVYTPKKSSWSR